jgi:hypothetical protein
MAQRWVADGPRSHIPSARRGNPLNGSPPSLPCDGTSHPLPHPLERFRMGDRRPEVKAVTALAQIEILHGPLVLPAQIGPLTRRWTTERAASSRRYFDNGRTNRGLIHCPTSDRLRSAFDGLVGGADRDLQRLGLRRLWHAHGQHALIELSRDTCRVDLLGQFELTAPVTP